jgi:hypothetical protein
MIKRKKKTCSSCGEEKYLFSKGRCEYCAKKQDSKPLKTSKKVDRGYGDFFVKHISIILNEKRCCDECGAKLIGHVSEVAHILAKSRHKEVAVEDNNVIYLCGMFSDNQCHKKFDSSLSARFIMNCFPLAKNKIEKIKEKVKIYSKEFAQLNN